MNTSRWDTFWALLVGVMLGWLVLPPITEPFRDAAPAPFRVWRSNDGSDSNTGLSPDFPVRTWEKVKQIIATQQGERHRITVERW